MYQIATAPAKNFVVCFIDEEGETCMPIASHDHETMEAAEAEATAFSLTKGYKHFAADFRNLITEL